MGYSNAKEVFAALARAYYEERNAETVLACVTDDVEWIGTETNETAKGKEELLGKLNAHFAAFPNSIPVKMDEPKVQTVGTDLAVLTLTGEKKKSTQSPVQFAFRGTLCCAKTEQGWLVFNLHMSAPNVAVEKASLLNALDIEREKQNALLENIPGGIVMYRIKKDGRIAIDYASDGVARICGYDTTDDFMKVTAYDARKLIVAEDYPIIEAAYKKAIESGTPTSIQYRVFTKAGEPLRITLDAVIMNNAQFGEDDVAVFYAVHTLVSEEETQKAEAQNILLSLLNTVPAGIGIFEVNESGITQNYLNDAFYQLIDSKREHRAQYTGANVLASSHPDDVAKLHRAMKQMLDGDDGAQLYYRVMGGQGSWVWLHLNACVVKRSSDSVTIHAAFNECTESRQQQLQLLQSQRAVGLAEQQGQISIWTYNIDRCVITQQIMPDTLSHLGYPVKIADVPNCFVKMDSIYPEDVENYLDAYKRLADGQEKVDVIYRLKNQTNGEYDWIHMYMQHMEDNDDGDRMAVGFSFQVNEQQAAIERYKAEQKLREQMYANAAVYLEYNLTTRRYEGENNIEMRFPAAKWDCATKEEFRAKMSAVIDERYLDDVVDKVFADNLMKSYEKGETKVTCRYRSKERPGMPSIWYRLTYTMVKRPDTGDIMAFVCVEDIEEEKDRQLAIESSTRDGIEIISVIRVADGRARVVRSSYATAPGGLGEYFTYSEEFVRRSHAGTVSEDKEFSYHAALLPTVLKELESKIIYQYSITTKLGNGPQKRQLFRFRYLDDRKAHIIMSVSDITSVYMEEEAKKKQLENALREAQNASRAKADFYSRMSHDLRTPMNGVLGMVALSEGETNSAKLQENMGKIKESGEYLLSLINDTLDIQRIESGKMKLEPTIVKSADVIRNIVEMVSVTAKAKGVVLNFSGNNTDLQGYIHADALRLKQIFINLLSNAVKFTPVGGTVGFEVKLLSREGKISHDVLYVRDTGVGMSKEFLETGIFKPFSQERNEMSANYAGSGLGLSIAKSLVEMMGGKIEVESELGVGTIFAVYLDFERVDDAEAQAAVQREKELSKDASKQISGMKILLAEDHPLNAEIAQKLLEKAGCKVTWAENGAKAVSCFADAPDNTFDAILMDIRMPLLDGLEATKQIRVLDKAGAATVPIIAMTANAYAEDVRACTQAGMNAHLGKPIVPKDLYNTLAKYMH